MRLEDEAVRREFKRRLRQTREEKWRFSQEEMAAEIRKHELDPEQPGYPGLRTYARWESETEVKDYLPATLEKLQAVARIVGFDMPEGIIPEAPSQFVIARRLDELKASQDRSADAAEAILERVKETNILLAEIRDKLVG